MARHIHLRSHPHRGERIVCLDHICWVEIVRTKSRAATTVDITFTGGAILQLDAEDSEAFLREYLPPNSLGIRSVIPAAPAPTPAR